jgi:predicted transcriptional regulator of viral defense system
MQPSSFFAAHPVFTHIDYRKGMAALRARTARGADRLMARANGAVLRVRTGLYAAVPEGSRTGTFAVDPFLLATKLAPDATVAYHAALQFHGKAHRAWSHFTVVSRNRIRPLSFHGHDFVGVRSPKALDRVPSSQRGVALEPYATGTVRVTTLARTLVDVLDVPSLGGGWEEIWRSLDGLGIPDVDVDAVVAYALRLGSGVTIARVGYFLEQHRAALGVEERHLQPLGRRVPRRFHFLSKGEAGQLVKPWNLVVPERLLSPAWRASSPSDDDGP